MRRLQAAIPSVQAGVRLGIGDDAAVLAGTAADTVVCTDMLVEGVDFADWASWADVGHKAAAVNLSDLAAMGARPRGLLLALGLRPDDAVADVLRLVRRLHAVGAAHGAPLVGGDISRCAGPLVVAVTAIGQLRRGAALRRQRAPVGADVWVSGSLGGAAAGLHALQAALPSPPSLRRRQLRPAPQVALGAALSRCAGVLAAVDVSDGLGQDVLHLPRPGAGVCLDLAALPMAPCLRVWARQQGLAPLQLALWGGEDFELAFAAQVAARGRLVALGRRLGLRLSRIGAVVAAPGLKLLGAPMAALAAGRGFDHFAPSRR